MHLSYKKIQTIPTSSFSSVMGIGIVSDAFLQLRIFIISEILEYVGVLVYMGLVVVFLLRLFSGNGGREKFSSNATSIFGSFAFVAGTAVLSTRVSESGYIFLDLPAIIVTIIFTSALAFLLLRPRDGWVFRQIQKPYLFLVPFIAMLGVSVLSSQTYSKLGTGYPYLYSVSLASWLIGFSGTILFIVYTLIEFKDRFLNPEDIDGFYFIYSGITSLVAFSTVVLLTFYHIDGSSVVVLFRYILTSLYVWAVGFSALLFYLFFLKFKRGHLQFMRSVSLWGVVFPMGVNAMGSYFISTYLRIHFLLWFSYFYASLGLVLILIYFVEIVVEIFIVNFHKI